ncbi:MAG: hypothetical protein KC466_03080, partial [Myxococcales bacterium]|nr:hypothetical protein [Myxococcales bacterium]
PVLDDDGEFAAFEQAVAQNGRARPLAQAALAEARRGRVRHRLNKEYAAKLRRHVPIDAIDIPYLPLVQSESERVSEIAQIIRARASAEEVQ